MSLKALVLVAAGFLGGVCSAIGGSGIDIASFATLTLLFRVSEKVRGTTTSYWAESTAFAAVCTSESLPVLSEACCVF
jgi:uncharacterized membrane protein YfcA